MEHHYSFLDDAVETFLEAFYVYEHLRVQELNRSHFPALARCLRSLYVALEKVFKHGLAQREPYLLLKEFKKEGLLQIYREKTAKARPTIFARGDNQSC